MSGVVVELPGASEVRLGKVKVVYNISCDVTGCFIAQYSTHCPRPAETG